MLFRSPLSPRSSWTSFTSPSPQRWNKLKHKSRPNGRLFLLSIFFDNEGMALMQVPTFFSPPFSFSLACQRKRKCAAGGGKEKEIVLAACRWLGQKTNYSTCVSAECLSICSAAAFAAAGAERFDNWYASGSGKRSRSIRNAA